MLPAQPSVPYGLRPLCFCTSGLAHSQPHAPSPLCAVYAVVLKLLVSHSLAHLTQLPMLNRMAQACHLPTRKQRQEEYKFQANLSYIEDTKLY